MLATAGGGDEAAQAGAVVVDSKRGFREVLEFVGDGADRLAASIHLPLGEVVGGVVVCPSLFNEFLKNYRREVVLARSLAARGIAVQRFQYRGTGNSDGDPLATTFESLGADAMAATDHLRETTGVSKVAFVGTRFGALPAAAAASTVTGAPVAVVEPVVSASGFFDEGFRNKLYAAGIRSKRDDDSGQPRSLAALVAKLEETGLVDVLGYSVGLGLYRSSTGHSLGDELGPEPRPLLCVQLGSDLPLRPELETITSAWEAGGFAVAVHQAGDREQWWLPDERDEPPGAVESRPHGLADEDPLVDLLGGWLEAQFTSAVVS